MFLNRCVTNMTKLKLQPDPTFKVQVLVPKPGAEPVDLELTFRHRTRDELQTFLEEIKTMDDVSMIQAMAIGWGLDDEFTVANIRTLVQGYIAAPAEIFKGYVDALTGHREKN